MSKNIMNTIKETKEIRVRGKVPTELLNLDVILQEVENATKPEELNRAAIYTKLVEEALTVAKKKINDAVKKELLIAKEVIDANKKLEAAIKDKYLDTVVFEATPKKNKDGTYKTDDNGEVLFNETSNIPKGVASYTPAKMKVVVDRDALIKSRKFTKKVVTYVIDEEKLNEHILSFGMSELPTKGLKTPAKISLQGKFLLKEENQLALLAQPEVDDDDNFRELDL